MGLICPIVHLALSDTLLPGSPFGARVAWGWPEGQPYRLPAALKAAGVGAFRLSLPTSDHATVVTVMVQLWNGSAGCSACIKSTESWVRSLVYFPCFDSVGLSLLPSSPWSMCRMSMSRRCVQEHNAEVCGRMAVMRTHACSRPHVLQVCVCALWKTVQGKCGAVTRSVQVPIGTLCTPCHRCLLELAGQGICRGSGSHGRGICFVHAHM
jgi:hypothetical protein